MNESQSSLIKQEVLDLAPWHIDVEIAQGITSAVAQDTVASKRFPGAKVGFINPREAFLKTLRTLFPNGLEYRSFLDCGCNCGAYCVWAKEMGAGRTLGVDVRDHWIQQAKLIQKYRKFPLLDFLEMDLEELSRAAIPRFDVTLFKGILHVLPDPMRGLAVAANLTRDVLILNTPVINVVDPEPLNGCFYLAPNPNESLVDGIHQLNWFPSGPKVLYKALEWLGFPNIKLHFFVKSPQVVDESTPLRGQKKGVVEIIAARQTGRLGRLVTVERDQAEKQN